MAFEAEPIVDCVDLSVAAIDNMKETETELGELKAHILSLTEKLKTANTKIKQLEQTVSDMEFYIENIEDTDVCFYTGFPNRQVYNAVLAYLNPGASGENLVYTRNESRPDMNSTPIRKIGRPRKLTPTNQFFLSFAERGLDFLHVTSLIDLRSLLELSVTSLFRGPISYI